jgi:hypothetical protein
VDDLDHLLGRAQALGDFSADGTLAYAGDEILDHFVMYIGLQQSQANLTQHLVHVSLA